MLFSDSYFTIQQASEGLFKDRGSKFLAFAFPVKNEAEIKEHLVQIRKEHHIANHHCYAYRLGADKLNFRANDDGEPSNSAGKPILGQIQSHDLTDILIIVSRYFGGTLLGVSGLINAYKLAAQDAIKNSMIIEKYITYRYRVFFQFENTSEVMKLLKKYDCLILHQGYEENSFMDIEIRKSHLDHFEDKAKAHGSPFINLKLI